jgi:hypothetical protein
MRGWQRLGLMGALVVVGTLLTGSAASAETPTVGTVLVPQRAVTIDRLSRTLIHAERAPNGSTLLQRNDPPPRRQGNRGFTWPKFFAVIAAIGLVSGGWLVSRNQRGRSRPLGRGLQSRRMPPQPRPAPGPAPGSEPNAADPPPDPGDQSHGDQDGLRPSS